MGEIRGVLEGFLASPSKTQGGLWGDDEASPAANAPDVSNSAPIQPPAPKAVCLFTGLPIADEVANPVAEAAPAGDTNPSRPDGYRYTVDEAVAVSHQVTDIPASIEARKAQLDADHRRSIPPESIEAFVAQVKTDTTKPGLSPTSTLATRRMTDACQWAYGCLDVAERTFKEPSHPSVAGWTGIVEWLNSLSFQQVNEVFA